MNWRENEGSGVDRTQGLSVPPKEDRPGLLVVVGAPDEKPPQAPHNAEDGETAQAEQNAEELVTAVDNVYCLHAYLQGEEKG